MFINGRDPAGTPEKVIMARVSEHSTEYDKLEAVLGKYQALNWFENEAVNELQSNVGPPSLKVIPRVPDWGPKVQENPKE